MKTIARRLAGWAGANLKALALSVLLLAVAIVAFRFVTIFVPDHRRAALETWYRDLGVRAEFRKDALERFFVDGLADAEMVTAFPGVLRALNAKASATDSAVVAGTPDARLEEFFENFTRSHGVLGVVLWDAEGKPRAWTRDFVLEDTCATPAREVLASGAPAPGFHLHGVAGAILTFSAPVRGANGDVRGVVVVAVDPRDWLYPLLAQPLAGTSSGEALLVRREGDDVLYLSPVHLRPESPLVFRRPLNSPEFLARSALEGLPIGKPYLDYRGVRVLAGARLVPPTPWAIVVKIDESEALSEFRTEVRRTALSLGSLAFAFLGILWGLWQMHARRQAAALSESEARYKTLLENIPEKIFIKSRTFRYVSINDNYARALGIRAEEAVGKRDDELFERDIADKYRADDERVMETARTEEFEEEYVRGASRSWIHTIKTPVKALSGEVIGVLGVFRDITERKKTEEALRLAEERFRVVAEALTDVIYEWDLKEGLEWFGDIDALLGYGAGEFPRSLAGWMEAVHPDDLGGVRAAIQAHLEDRAPYLADYRMLRKDGTVRHWTARGKVVRTPDGSPVRWIGSITDVSERERANAALRESESRFRQLTESLPQLVWTCQPDGPCDYFNRQWVEFTGVPEAQQFGYGWLEQLHPEDRAPTVAAWQAAVASGTNFRVEFRIRRHDGEYRWFDTQAVRLRDAEGRTVKWYGSNTDITDRKRAEDEVRRLNAGLEERVLERTAQLEVANKELEAFSYSVSHDLRAPLRAVDGFSRILLEDHAPQLDAEGKRLLDVVRSNTLRMGQLIDDLLSFSRIGRKEIAKSDVDMAALARAAFEEQRAEDDAVAVAVGELPRANVDPSLMKQVFTNLISNALKFTRPKEARAIEIDGRTEKDRVVYRVRDNGVGFDMAYSNKLFGVFQRLHAGSEFEGTGVGLALVQRIVNRHGGEVWGEGKVGEGAAFSFSLPRGGGPSCVPETAPSCSSRTTRMTPS